MRFGGPRSPVILNVTLPSQFAQLQQIVARNIRARRAVLGFSQKELGKRCGSSDTMISGLERGAVNPTLATIAAVAEALDVTVNRLFSDGGGAHLFTAAISEDGRITNNIANEDERVLLLEERRVELQRKKVEIERNSLENERLRRSLAQDN